MTKMRKFFDQLDVDKTNKVRACQLDETLISFGLCKTKEEVNKVIQEIDKHGTGTIDFDQFMHLIKDSSLTGQQSYLKDRNILYEPIEKEKTEDELEINMFKLPKIKSSFIST